MLSVLQHICIPWYPSQDICSPRCLITTYLYSMVSMIKRVCDTVVSMFQHVCIPWYMCYNTYVFCGIHVPIHLYSVISMFQHICIPWYPCYNISVFRGIYDPTHLYSVVSVIQHICSLWQACSNVHVIRGIYFQKNIYIPCNLCSNTSAFPAMFQLIGIPRCLYSTVSWFQEFNVRLSIIFFKIIYKQRH